MTLHSATYSAHPLPPDSATPSVDPAIHIQGLTKWFRVSHGYRDLVPFRPKRRVRALNRVTLEVPAGGVFGLLGPNGAGKTSLFKILAGLYAPTEGTVSVLGYDVVRQSQAVKRVLVYSVSEERSLYWRLTGRQNLQFFGVLNEIPHRSLARRIDEVLDLLGLQEAADRRVMQYSSGMKQKLTLARTLLTDPEVLLLDEPTRSMDPLAAREFWRFVRDELVRQREKTVLMATHNMGEARDVCDRLAVLHRGEIKAMGTVSELTRLLGAQHRYVITLSPASPARRLTLPPLPGILEVQYGEITDETGYRLEVSVSQPAEDVPAVIRYLTNAGAEVLSCVPEERSLSDVLEDLTTRGVQA